MHLQQKRVAIVGLGASGLAAARLCMARGAEVVGYDESKELRPIVAALAKDGVSLRLGPLAPDALADADLVVVSPGVPEREALSAAPCEVISEVELASRFLSAPVVLVGGTNGKSTVTALTHLMLEKSGVRAFIGGNYGTPLCEAVDQPVDVAVVEVSSFQAERVPTLRARVNVLLNISEDHLDRYDSYAAYAAAKGNPFVNMTADDVAVIPAGDAACAAQAARGQARQVTFSVSGAADVWLDDDTISAGALRVPLADVALRGRHNFANACAAIAAAREVGATDDGISAALRTFTGLPHRHTLVAEIAGVRFYDDSKATNVGAAVAALGGLEEERAVLIAGGRDKMGAYEPLVAALKARGRALVVLGEAAERIALAAAGVLPIEHATSFDDAVERAAALAQPGDAVLLSPACSSYDMFADYKERGVAFAAKVNQLRGDT